jgi:hypothetical protein
VGHERPYAEILGQSEGRPVMGFHFLRGGGLTRSSDLAQEAQHSGLRTPLTPLAAERQHPFGHSLCVALSARP